MNRNEIEILAAEIACFVIESGRVDPEDPRSLWEEVWFEATERGISDGDASEIADHASR